MGARHSWSGAAAADANAVVIDTSGMDRVLAIDTERLVVKVEPGVTLRQLRDVLTRRGLTLPSWPMLLDQTLAGAAATGSHGSSARDGSLSDVVVAMRLVTGQGDDGVVVAGAEGAEGGGVRCPGRRDARPRVGHVDAAAPGGAALPRPPGCRDVARPPL